MNSKIIKKTEKEQATVAFMIQFYCRNKHKITTLCPDCANLTQYAQRKLNKCPFGEKKTTCRLCSIHCYEPEMKQKIREVMQYVGPRMIFHAPIFCFKHWLKLK